MDPTGRLRLAHAPRGHPVGMRLKTTLVALGIAGSTALTGCGGSNTDLERGETNCDGGDTNSQDSNCQEDQAPDPAENT